MKKFLDENFDLSNGTAVKLYHDYAEKMPIYDFHCHLDPREIYEDKNYSNITEIWLYGDHYKWRAMRGNGVDEKYITGNASDYEKFLAWSRTVPKLIGNPLYVWTHLELQRYFNIHETLDENTAENIWNEANSIIKNLGFSARSLMKKSNVKVVCTTDDPADTLEYHRKIKNEGFDVKIVPGFRPDKALEIRNGDFVDWIGKLEKASNINIQNYDDFLQALNSRIEFFNESGCKISDHSLTYVPYMETSKKEVSEIFGKRLNFKKLNRAEEEKYKTYTLRSLGEMYFKFNWSMQFHIGAMRNNNTNKFNELGPNTGFDSMNDCRIAEKLAGLLDSLERDNVLPKTVLYTLNPSYNYVISSMLGNFQGLIPGKIQFGPAWWFNDNKDGMEEQMKALSNCGLLTRFIGMATDSRSFLSYARHEYFRRIVCNLIGKWVENGEVPCDMNYLGRVIQDISFNNARNYFEI